MKSNFAFHKLPITALIITTILIFPPLSGRASEDFDIAVSEAILSILEKLTYAEKLQGKKLAVLGFSNATTNVGCKHLSPLLANRIISELDRYRPISKDKYAIMFKRRGPAEIVDDQSVQISWEGNFFTVIGQKLENVCDDCVHVLEFEHR